MLRTLLTLLTLLLPAIAAVPAGADAGTGSHAPPPPVADTRVLRADILPGPTGWTAVALTVDVDSVLTLEGTLPPPARADKPSRAHLLVAREGGGHPAPVGSGSSTFSIAAVDARGARVACCGEPVMGAPGGGGEFEAGGWWLAAGDTLWIGLLAYEVDPSQGEVVIRSDAGTLISGEARSGTDVQFVDLVDEAKRRAIGADLLGRRLVGGAGDVHLDWWPTGAGFFELSYQAWGDARATLGIEVPSETVLDGEVVAEEWGHVTAMQQGRFAVSFTDVDPGRHRPFLLGPTGELRAEVLYADLHLPGEGLYVWSEG